MNECCDRCVLRRVREFVYQRFVEDGYVISLSSLAYMHVPSSAAFQLRISLCGTRAVGFKIS